jgi:hypothetical protein
MSTTDTETIDQPLGKPEGTVRSYLALGLVGAFALSHVAGALAFAVTGHATEAMALLAMISTEAAAATAFYFGARPGAK